MIGSGRPSVLGWICCLQVLSLHLPSRTHTFVAFQEKQKASRQPSGNRFVGLPPFWRLNPHVVWEGSIAGRTLLSWQMRASLGFGRGLALFVLPRPFETSSGAEPSGLCGPPHSAAVGLCGPCLRTEGGHGREEEGDLITARLILIGLCLVKMWQSRWIFTSANFGLLGLCLVYS